MEDESFLKQFVGQPLYIEGESQFDAISGATISSTAVKAGVDRANASLLEALKGGAAE